MVTTAADIGEVEKFKWKNYSRERRQCQRITSRTIIPIVAAGGGNNDDDD
jgi:hypothetical protein